MTDPKEYEALLACYRSGQVSERQWTEHLKDTPALACKHERVGADGYSAKCLDCGADV